MGGIIIHALFESSHASGSSSDGVCIRYTCAI